MSTLRTLMRVDLRIDQEWAIGAAPDLYFRPDPSREAVRMPVQRDADGQFLLPATSLIGGLRRHLGDAGDAWLGSADDSTTTPSALRCLAATVHPLANAPLEPRTITTTAMDAARRAPKGGSLRTEEVLPQALVTWWLEWDHGHDALDLNALLASLAQWRPVIGRRRSANRGRAHVQQLYYRTVDLATTEGLTWWLAERPALNWLGAQGLPSPDWKQRAGTTPDEGTAVIRQTFKVVDALHLGGHGTTKVKRTSRDQDDNVNDTKEVTLCGDVVPSTTWKGIFRHRVEQIVRVSTDSTPDEIEATVARLFGSSRQEGASEQGGHRGVLRFADSDVHGSKQQRTHVAIDRITGGAAQLSGEDPLDTMGLLYTVEYFGPGATLNLTIYNDSDTPLSADDQRLLEWVVQDIDDGIIGIGGMTSRGYGTLKTVKGAR